MSESNKRLSGKVAIVIGASDGFGEGDCQSRSRNTGGGLYLEMGPHDVRAVCITPSWGTTDFANSSNLPDVEKDLGDRMIQPADIGNLCVDICSLPEHWVIPEITLLPLV